MMQGFKLLFATTRLEASPSKTSIYCSGMSTAETQRVTDMTGFAKGTFPLDIWGSQFAQKRSLLLSVIKLWRTVCKN